MYINPTVRLRKIALVLSFSTDIRKVPDMLEAMSKFLEEEPIENFSATSFHEVENVPLTLNEKAVESFKKTLSKFPTIYESGKSGQKDFNFLYALGQLLTQIALVLNSYELKNPKLQHPVKLFYQHWGSYNEMNARSLVDKFAGKDPGEVKRSLLLRLTASANLIKKEVFPLL